MRTDPIFSAKKKHFFAFLTLASLAKKMGWKFPAAAVNATPENYIFQNTWQSIIHMDLAAVCCCSCILPGVKARRSKRDKREGKFERRLPWVNSSHIAPLLFPFTLLLQWTTFTWVVELQLHQMLTSEFEKQTWSLRVFVWLPLPRFHTLSNIRVKKV